MTRALLLAALLSGCAATYDAAHSARPPAWTQAVDFALGTIAAGVSVYQYDVSPTHDGALGALIVCQTFWWSGVLIDWPDQ